MQCINTLYGTIMRVRTGRTDQHRAKVKVFLYYINVNEKMAPFHCDKCDNTAIS